MTRIHFARTPLPTDLDQHLKDIEREIVLDALQAHNGLRCEAARAIGLTRKQMYYLIKKHDIDVSELRVAGMAEKFSSASTPA